MELNFFLITKVVLAYYYYFLQTIQKSMKKKVEKAITLEHFINYLIDFSMHGHVFKP